MTTLEVAPPADGRPHSPWREVALVRELHGLAQVLSTRPWSVGNEIALLRARDDLVELGWSGVAELSSSAAPLAAVIERILADAEGVAPQALGARMLEPLARHLREDRTCSDVLDLYLPSTVATPRPEVLVVSVGPTIGIGDEFLVARALARRCKALGTHLCVSSRRSMLWDAVHPEVSILAGPPFGAAAELDDLVHDQTWDEVHSLHVDFLESDPAPHPYEGPPGVRRSGRWFMGTAIGDAFAAADRTHRFLRCPPGLPASRWIESQWVAARWIPGALPTTARTPGSQRTVPRVILQTLTSKPYLILPPQFYAETLRRLDRRIGLPFVVDIIPAPTRAAQEYVRQVARQVADQLGADRIHLPDKLDLKQVLDHVRASDVLFGPDTFSAHFAAFARSPQVTLTMPQHLPWVSPGTPGLFVVLEGEPRALVDTCVRRLTALLSIAHDPDTRRHWHAAARRWGAPWCALEEGVQRVLEGRSVDEACVDEAIASLNDLYVSLRGAVGDLLGQSYRVAPPAFVRFSPSAYADEGERALALVRYYASYATSDLGGLMEAST